jgi:alanine racemase
VLNWVEIDGAAIHHNVSEFRRRVGTSVKIGAVVKSNAYGHGMLEVAALALEAGADWLCVNDIDEALRLRAAWARVPILILGYVALDALREVVEHDLRPVVYNHETLERLEEAAERLRRRVRVHLKVETGTHRQGVSEAEIAAFVTRLASSGWLELEGMSTHFANIEDTTDHRFAEAQIAAFQRVHDALRERGGPIPMRHAACSAAALLFTRTHLDLIRIGISLYGLWPSKETYVSLLEKGRTTLDLRPALAWKTRIAQVKAVPEGGYVGYGCTFRTTRASRIAVLPVGYHEGYDRRLSGVAHVLVRGRRAAVRGRVCMNMCMVDVTDIPGVAVEDEVVLLGGQADERIGAEQLAAWCGTIPYEIVSRIHPALPRVVSPPPPPRAGLPGQA